MFLKSNMLFHDWQIFTPKYRLLCLFEYRKHSETAEKMITFKLELKIVLREDYSTKSNLHYNIE
jgi:hypothetical protein